MSDQTYFSRLHFWVTLIAASIATASCTNDPARSGNNHTADRLSFEAWFTATGQVELEEPAEFPLAEVTALVRSEGGEYFIVDRPSHQVRIHAADGSFLRVLGGFGRGPGELGGPTDVALSPDGRVYVTEADNGRISVFDAPTGAFDTLFASPTPLPFQIDNHPRGFLVGSYAGGSHQYYLMADDGAILSQFFARDPRIAEVPYWGSVTRDYATVVGSNIIAASSLLYPMQQFDGLGTHRGSFGTAPSSWRKPTEPEAGAFMGREDTPALRRWLASLTVITDIRTMADSIVLVAHGRFGAALVDSEAMSDVLRLHEESLDIYSRHGERLGTNIALPGEMVWSDEAAYVITDVPPQPWTITWYVPTPSESLLRRGR